MHQQIEQGVAALPAQQPSTGDRHAHQHGHVEDRDSGAEEQTVTEVQSERAPDQDAERQGHHERPAAHTANLPAQEEAQEGIEQADGDRIRD